VATVRKLISSMHQNFQKYLDVNEDFATGSMVLRDEYDGLQTRLGEKHNHNR